MSLYQRAVLMIILAGAFLSTAGLGIRLLHDANGMEIVFYRALGMVFFMLGVLRVRGGSGALKGLARVDRNDMLAAVFYAVASFTVVFAILHTTVANVMFIISLAPFIAALLGRVVLGERVGLRTWIAIAVATVGVLIMVEGGISGDGYLGIALAFAMAVAYASFTVTLRHGKSGDMIPAVCWAGAIVAVVALLSRQVGVPSAHDLLICVGLGVFQTGVGALLMVLGSRHVPAAQIAFLAMLEVVLSPVWVWLVVGETPAAASLLGGGVILAAIAYQALGSMERKSPA